MKMNIISLIGFSGSGKTHFIVQAIELLRANLNFKIACIKNVHQHDVDVKGKDSFKFMRAGATYSIIKNQHNELAIFLRHDFEIHEVIDWISKGPLKLDLIFIEGFRKLSFPTILCVKEYNEIAEQLSDKVRMISGVLTSKSNYPNEYKGIPIRNLKNAFTEFLNTFDISDKR